MKRQLLEPPKTRDATSVQWPEHNSSCSPTKNAGVAVQPPANSINVVVLHSDNAITAQIMETYTRIQNGLKEAHSLGIHLWILDLLDEPELLAAASQDLASADMIVVNVNDERLSSEPFQRWAQSWPESNGRKPRALVGFQADGAGARFSRATRHLKSLRELAAHKGMDFLTNAPEPVTGDIGIPVVWQALQDDSQGVLLTWAPQPHAVLTGHESSNYRSYGINE